MSDTLKRFKRGDKVIRVNWSNGPDMIVGNTYAVEASTIGGVRINGYSYDANNFRLAKSQIVKDIINDL